MEKFRFNKIIRSKLIDIMETDGVKVIKQELSYTEYYRCLLNKLIEETEEVVDACNDNKLTEELADVFTVIDAICSLKNIGYSQIEEAKEVKKKKKGDFSNKVKVDHVEYDGTDKKFKEYNEYYLANPKKYPKIDVVNIDDSTILHLEENANPEIDEILVKNLRKYNESRVGPYLREPFTVYIKQDSQIIAGATARILGDSCRVEILWVSELHRKNGLGSKIMQRLETHAKTKKCKAIELDTAAFRAKDFYIKLGFEVAANLDKSFLGHTLYIMRKNL